MGGTDGLMNSHDQLMNRPIDDPYFLINRPETGYLPTPEEIEEAKRIIRKENERRERDEVRRTGRRNSRKSGHREGTRTPRERAVHKCHCPEINIGARYIIR